MRFELVKPTSPREGGTVRRLLGSFVALSLIVPLARGSEPEKACDTFGTSVEFVNTPSEAARLAREQQKLVFVLHVSGNFEDPRFT